MCEEVQTIIIDNGSGMIKSGFGGEESPRSVFPTIIGRPKQHSIHQKDMYVGEACEKAENLILNYPIEHGIITNWDDMEKIWHHMFYNELHVDPIEHPVLHIEAAKNPKFNREKLIEYMFETFNVPSFYIGIQNAFSLVSSGRTTGVVCEIGDGQISVVSIVEGYYIRNAVKRINIGGRDISNYLKRLLNKRGIIFAKVAENKALFDIKKKCTYIATDFNNEIQKFKSSYDCNVEYTFSDGNVIEIADEQFRCAEIIFKPLMNEFEMDAFDKMIEIHGLCDLQFNDGVDKLIFDSIMKCGMGDRKNLYSNIVLSGGSSMIDGLKERIENEITKLAPPKMKVNVYAPSDRMYSAWNGGSIFASLETYTQKVVTHDEYNDAGPGIVFSKF